MEQICAFCWLGIAAAMFTAGKLFALRVSSSESYVLIPFKPSLNFDMYAQKFDHRGSSREKTFTRTHAHTRTATRHVFRSSVLIRPTFFCYGLAPAAKYSKLMPRALTPLLWRTREI